MEKNKNLIAISGKSGSGKDLAARIIQLVIIKKIDPSFLVYPISNTIDPITNSFPRSDGTIQDYIKHFYLPLSTEKISDYKIVRFASKLKQIVSILIGIPVLELEKEEVKASYLPEEWNTYMVQKFEIVDTLQEVDTLKADDNLKIAYSYRTGGELIPRYRVDYWEKVHRMTVREMLQKVGTDALRNVIHPSANINAMFAEYKPLISSRSVLLDFSNDLKELDASKPIYGEYPKWIIPDLRFKNEYQAIIDRGGITIRLQRDYDKSDPKFLHQSETDLDEYEDKDMFDITINNNGIIEQLIGTIERFLKEKRII